MKPKVERIKFSKEQQEEIDLLKQGKAKARRHGTLSSTSVKNRLCDIYGGLCHLCQDYGTVKVLYDVGDAKRVERYCDLCFKKSDIK